MIKPLQKYFIWFIIILGVTLRFAEYIADPSLNKDEAITAERLVIPLYQSSDQSPSLLKVQGYPVGFFAVEKLAFALFGAQEWALRLFPFVCGIISLFLFLKVARLSVGMSWALLAFGVFAISRDLVFRTSELKPYSSDVMVVLLLYLMFYQMAARSLSIRQLVLYGIGGIIAIYFSYPAIFILMAVGAWMFVEAVVKKRMMQAKQICLLGVIWGGAFLIYYFYSISHLMQNPRLMSDWSVNFLPLDQGYFVSLQWMVVAFKRLFANSLQFPSSLAGLLFIIGAVSMFHEQRKWFSILIPSVLISLILSALKLYPFEGRAITFLFPTVILLVVFGIKALSGHNEKYKNVIGASLTVLLLFYPVQFSARQLLEPFGAEEIKPVMEYIQKQKQEDDLVTIYQSSLQAFNFYADRYGFSKSPLMLKKGKPGDFVRRIKDQQSDGLRRVWIIFTHVRHDKRINERQWMLSYFDSVGEQLDSFLIKTIPNAVPVKSENNISASVYLYEF